MPIYNEVASENPLFIGASILTLVKTITDGGGNIGENPLFIGASILTDGKRPRFRSLLVSENPLFIGASILTHAGMVHPTQGMK